MPKPEFLAEELKKDLPHLKHLICLGAGSKKSLNFTELVAQESMDFAPLEIKDEDISTIFYTSGTTGTPKGAPLNYLQLNAPPLALKYFVNLSAQDINLCTIPLSHSGGWVCTLFSITAGMTLVLMERFNPLEFLRHIEKHKVTCFLLVPSMYLAILQLKEFEKFDLTSLRWVTVFGAPSSPEMLRRFHQYCPQADFFNGWGMTETCPPTTVLPLDRLNKLESVGKPVPWVEIKVVNDEGREMANGEIGEIICRGWPVAKGYFKDEKLTQEAIRDGWLYSGDLGTFDEEGLLYVVGRKKDMIKVAGQIVFAHEIEAALEKHPQLAEVAVVGIKDKLRGEVPKVFIVPKPGEEIGEQAVRDFCRQHLAHFKIPQAIEFRDSLPKTRSGKIQKEILKMGE
jgi:acyl-CoA synthetase (AMP-forming)/AMP-acid ligase II